MIANTKAAVAVAAIVGAWLLLRKRAPLPTGGATMGPVEMIDTGGKVVTAPTGTTSVLVPRPGEVTNVDSAPPYNQNVAALCACAPLFSFGPACAGYTWAPIPFVGSVEFRNKIPVTCQ